MTDTEKLHVTDEPIPFARPELALARLKDAIGKLTRPPSAGEKPRARAAKLPPAPSPTDEPMPYINIKITREGATPVQKARLITGVTDLLINVLKTDPSLVRIDISEVEMEDWRLGGLTFEEYRRR